VGANQTTDQPGIFGGAARFAVDAPVPDGSAWPANELAARAFVAAAAGVAAGVAHVNLPFRGPLPVPLPAWFADGESRAGAVVAAARALVPGDPDPVSLPRGPRTIVVAGSDAGDDAELLAHEGGWPLIAEIVSGARYGRQVVHGYRQALADPQL